MLGNEFRGKVGSARVVLKAVFIVSHERSTVLDDPRDIGEPPGKTDRRPTFWPIAVFYDDYLSGRFC